MKKAGKKKKSKKKSATVPLKKLEQQGRQALKSGRFRRARDAYKRLVKQDHDRYAADLLEAQAGLFHQLMDERRHPEARKVLGALKKLDSGRTVCVARMRLAIAEGDFVRAAGVAAETCSLEPPEMSYGACSEGSLSADALVLAFEAVGSLSGLSSTIRTELNCITAALAHVAEGRFDAALEQIKPVGLNSIFSNWKWFLKGICAFYRRQDDKARTALGKILPGSAPAKAAEAYTALLSGQNAEGEIRNPPQLVQHTCLVAGQETIGKALARSQYLWEVGRFRDSLKHLRDRLTNFPTLTRGIGQALSLFYYTAFYDMEELGAENYVLSLVSTATNDRRSTALEKFLAHRALALWLEGTPAPDMEILTAWEEALSRFQALSCDGHHATPLVYGRLGDLFSVEEPDEDPFDFFFTRRREQSQILRNARLAEFCYCKGIKADRQNRHCWFSLLSLYEKTGNKPKTNKTLDDIIKHFPEEKEAMFKAGIRCLERKAFIKGMNYLDQAQKLDPIDSRVRESFMVACILVALKQTQNGRLQKRRTALEKAEARAYRTADDFNTGLCYLYARWAVMEALAGENDEAEQRMKKALSLAPNPLKLHYFTVLIGRMYGVRPVWAAESRRIADEALAGTPNPEVGVSLADVLRYLHSFQRPKDGWLDRERNKINRYLMKAAGRSCSREQAQAIIDYASHPRVKAWNLKREYVELMLRRNPEDARFRWARLIPDFDRDRHPAGLHNLRIELATVLDLAHKQGEQDVAEQVERALKQVDRQLEARKSISEFLGMDPEMDFDEPDNTYNDFLHSCEASEIAEGSSEKQTRKHAPEPCRQLNLFDFE